MKYRADIDGLRAVAIISVILYHFSIEGFDAGFLGVDVFFVISGFLITTQIHREIASGDFSFRRFWLRRARRILPALLVMTIACLAVGWAMLTPHDFAMLGSVAASSSVFASNIALWILFGGYFTPGAESAALLHTWSLSIEEQFYLLLPIAMFVVWQWFRSYLLPGLLLVIAAGLALSIWGGANAPSASYFLFPTRMWELAIGAALAIVVNDRRVQAGAGLAELLAFGGVAGILCSLVFFDRSTVFPGLAALLPCVSAAMLIFANVDHQTIVARALSIRPVVFIGLISYSLYLWHWPALVFMRYRDLDRFDTNDKLITALIALGFALASYKFIEVPARRRKIIPNQTIFGVTCALLSATIAASGVLVFSRDGVPSRIPDVAGLYASGADDRTSPALCPDHETICRIVSAEPSAPALLLWGDSHAYAILPAFQDLAIEHGVELWYSRACLFQADAVLDSAADDNCSLTRDETLAWIGSHDPNGVVMALRWTSAVEQRLTDSEEYFESGLRSPDAIKSNRVRFLQDTEYAVRKTADKDIPFWFVRQVPEYRFYVPRKLYMATVTRHNVEDIGLDRTSHDERGRYTASVLQGLAMDTAHVIDPASVLCNETRCRVERDGRALYHDDDHLTVFGAKLLKPIIEPVFTAITANSNPEGASQND